jgi:Glycosyltransferase Family 4
MHIAYLIPTVDRIGGAERQLIQLATGMARRDWRVTVIALSGNGGHAAEELSANNVSFLSLEMRKGLADLRGWNRLRRWITSAQPEILHSHLPHASMMSRGIRSQLRFALSSIPSIPPQPVPAPAKSLIDSPRSCPTSSPQSAAPPPPPGSTTALSIASD